jgi:hypothetical protein
MSNVTGLRPARDGIDLKINEADELRAENQQLYRLILQLVSDLDNLENALSDEGAVRHSINGPSQTPESA